MKTKALSILFIATGLLLLSAFAYTSFVSPNLKATKAPSYAYASTHSIIFQQLSGQTIAIAVNGTMFNVSAQDMTDANVTITLINATDKTTVATLDVVVKNIKSNTGKPFTAILEINIPVDLKLTASFGTINYTFGIIPPLTLDDVKNNHNVA